MDTLILKMTFKDTLIFKFNNSFFFFFLWYNNIYPILNLNTKDNISNIDIKILQDFCIKKWYLEKCRYQDRMNQTDIKIFLINFSLNFGIEILAFSSIIRNGKKGKRMSRFFLIPRTHLRLTAFRRSLMGLSSALHAHPHRAVTVHQLWDCLCAGQASLCLCTNEVPIRTFTHGEPFGFRSVPSNTTNVTVSTRERSRKLFRLQYIWSIPSCRYILR